MPCTLIKLGSSPAHVAVVAWNKKKNISSPSWNIPSTHSCSFSPLLCNLDWNGKLAKHTRTEPKKIENWTWELWGNGNLNKTKKEILWTRSHSTGQPSICRSRFHRWMPPTMAMAVGSWNHRPRPTPVSRPFSSRRAVPRPVGPPMAMVMAMALSIPPPAMGPLTLPLGLLLIRPGARVLLGATLPPVRGLVNECLSHLASSAAS